jgi:hypothetical protein
MTVAFLPPLKAMSWRPCPFQAGKLYRVKSNFQSLQFQFLEGQLLAYRGQGYSRYDSATIYNFDDAAGRGNFQWWLSDNEDPGKWKEFFECVHDSI